MISSKFIAFLMAFAGLITLVLAPGSATAQQKIAIPAYFYPSYPDPLWIQMEDAAPTVGLAVMNPANGPGVVADANYVAQIADTRAAGIAVLGYVYTSYTARSAAVVEADIDTFYSLYDIDGIFIDETSNNCADQAYYASLKAYVAGKDASAVTVINPGINTPECFINTADIILNFEGTWTNYQSWTPSGWETGYDANRFWHLVHGTPEGSVADAVLLSQQNNAGWVYVTPDGLPNPWDTLPSPSYWSTELDYVAPHTACPAAADHTKLIVKGLTTPDGDDILKLAGRATLPDTGVLSPVTAGVRLLVTDSNAAAVATVADVTIAGGAYDDLAARGWKTNGKATKWIYKDRSAAPVGGVVRLIVKNRAPAGGVGQVVFKLKAVKGNFGTADDAPPLSATVFFDADIVGAPCGKAGFDSSACALNGSGRTLKCK
ncbi:MAG: hypothetical protein ACI8TX_000300 [Hyphomicrobiaceae bacterium]|jgi:hypothetical protein